MGQAHPLPQPPRATPRAPSRAAAGAGRCEAPATREGQPACVLGMGADKNTLRRRSSRALGHAARPCHPFVRERRRARACGALRERTLAVREHRPLDPKTRLEPRAALPPPTSRARAALARAVRLGGGRRGRVRLAWARGVREGRPKGGQLQLWVWVWVSLRGLVSGVGNTCRG